MSGREQGVAWLETQRQNLVLWAPVGLALGIGLYFSLPFEPPTWVAGLAGLASVVLLWLAWRTSSGFRLLILAVFFLNLGYLASVYRSVSVSAPVLTFRYYGPVEGRIINIDRSASNALRVTLDQVVLDRVRKTPKKVRVSLFGFLPDELTLGARVAVVANLSPPGGPVEPSAFDFRRHAWFDQLGAVGYSNNPLILMRPYAEQGRGLWLAKIRRNLAEHVAQSVGGQRGAFAAAIVAGDRSRIDQDALQTLRDSNLAHLLAISGLHMGLLTGFVFLIVRHALALVPRIALRMPVKKIGAVAALLAGLGYLFLSGGNVATQRAFIMAAVVLFAVILDRPAFSLRAVALAALLVLLMRPESLTEAGFQMSFSATTALVAVFDLLRTARWWKWLRSFMPRRLFSAFTILMTSAIAGAATAPVAAIHFNQISNFGLLANLLSVPVMGLIIMPAAVVALFLSLFGLGYYAFLIMGLGIGWVLEVAAFISGFENAITTIPNGHWAVLPIIGISGCLLVLLRGRSRIVGVASFFVAMTIWVRGERPEVLVNDNGALIGILSEQGRILNKETAYRFSASIWLENDGDRASQSEAFFRPGISTISRVSTVDLSNGWHLILNQNKEVSSCDEATILIAPKIEEKPNGDCSFIGKQDIAALNGFSITFREGTPVITSAMPETELRPWTNGGAPYQ